MSLLPGVGVRKIHKDKNRMKGEGQSKGNVFLVRV